MKIIRYTPCYDCGCREYFVIEDLDGYVIIKCRDCERCLTEGYGSPEELVKKKRLRTYSDEEIFSFLDSWEIALEEARSKDNKNTIMLYQGHVNDFQGELLRRNLTEAYTVRKQEEAKRKRKAKRTNDFINRNKKYNSIKTKTT